MKDLKRERLSKSGTAVADVILIDQSMTPGGKRAPITVSVFGAAKIAILNEKIGEPMRFFHLVISVKSGKPEVTHYDDEIVERAPPCPKTEALLGNKGELKDAVDTEQLTAEWTPEHSARDVSGSQPMSCAAFFDYTSEEPTAGLPAVQQLLWLHIEEPQPGDEVLEANKTRVWYQASGRDASGSAQLGMPQKNAFKLSNTNSVADFPKKPNRGL